MLSNKDLPEDIPIAIIGGGFTGVSCAMRLRELGHESIVIDRGRSLGGRMSSKLMRYGDIEIWIDQGAPKIDTSSDQLHDQAIAWIANGIAVWQDHDQLIGVPSMQSMVEAIGSPLIALTSSQVISVQRNNPGWMLSIEQYGHSEQSLLRADTLVFACPAEQAARLLRKGSLAVPTEIDCIRSSTAWIHMLVARGLDVRRDRIAIHGASEDTISEIRICHKGDGVYSVVSELGPARSASLHDALPERVGPMMLSETIAQIESHCGISVNPGMIGQTRVHRWGLARPTSQIQAPFFFDEPRQLAFAGDWYAGDDGQWRNAEAAYLSGVTLAEQLVRSSSLK